MNRKVTIGIPTLNRAEYLRLAVESALNQTYRNIEVIVSNNGSTDDTAAMLQHFSDPRLRVLSRDVTVGVVENWNTCLRAATGEYFLVLSDDDLLDPHLIESLVKAFEQGPVSEESVGLSYCRARVIDEYGKPQWTGPSAPAKESAEHMMIEFFNGRRMTWACTLLFRTSDIVARGYTPELGILVDAEQWMQAVTKRGFAVFTNAVLASYRVHMSATTSSPATDWQKETADLAERAIVMLSSKKVGDEQIYAHIRESAKRQEIRLVTSLLNQKFRRKKFKALAAYFANWREFTSTYGIYALSVGLADLYVPNLLHMIFTGKQRLRLSRS